MLKSFLNKNLLEAGCDEAGRGCLAGPVFAASVILPTNFKNDLLNDSKQLSEKHRYELRDIIEKEALYYGVGCVNEEEIDKINILNASFLAMHRAIEKMKVVPEFLLIDGNRFNKYQNIAYKCIIGGDGKYLSIAAASILAKTYRDDHMLELHKEYPHYNWEGNKGYATQKHREAIKVYGPTKYHRKSFTLLPRQTKLNL